VTPSARQADHIPAVSASTRANGFRIEQRFLSQ
jgi:hypothetical protein